MRLLLDTHTALWWMADDPRLSDRAGDELTRDGNVVLLSAVVAWEVAVKRALGKLRAGHDIWERLAEAGAASLAISIEHAQAVEHLPPHHRDPFDRLLVAQASVERAVLVSRDDVLQRYDVPVIW